MEDVDISVVLVLRDRADTAPTTLAHLEQQTLPASRFEVIAVEHGSQDRTLAVLQNYAAGAPVRIRVIDAGKRNFARARNLGAEQAQGKWLIFLDQDLLASPNLLERYLLEFQAHEEPSWLLGAVDLHPQIPANMLTRRLAEERWRPAVLSTPLAATEWQGENLGMGRIALLNRGGFDESFDTGHLLEVALAAQLAKEGIHGRPLPRAFAYEWKSASFDEECQRAYARGHALRHLEARIGAEAAMPLHPDTHGFRWRIHQLMMPFYIRACQGKRKDLRHIVKLYRRVLDHEVQRGYNDACRSRLARP